MMSESERTMEAMRVLLRHLDPGIQENQTLSDMKPSSALRRMELSDESEKTNSEIDHGSTDRRRMNLPENLSDNISEAARFTLTCLFDADIHRSFLALKDGDSRWQRRYRHPQTVWTVGIWANGTYALDYRSVSHFWPTLLHNLKDLHCLQYARMSIGHGERVFLLRAA
jgi:hypothetical protein